ncbi:MAG: peptidase MA domain-containing protein [Dehalococcoidia bacterium]|nr:peptidase MA domain-containing protein [Dehalococcoidia bacterium]
MIKRTLLLVITLCLLLSPSFAQADEDISILDSRVESNFPDQLVFHLDARSSSNIIDARLHYQVDKMNYAEVTSESWPVFTPDVRIETSWTWDTRRASLPPGAAVTYWWTVEDKAGNEVVTSPETVHFDDERYDWQSLNSDIFSGLTLSWYEGNSSFAAELMDTCETGLARLTEEMGIHPEDSIKIYVYASSEDLRGAMIFPMEWTGGAAYTEFGIVVIGISQSQLDWGKRALVHELTHLIVHQATFSPYGRLPTWLDEGLAVYNEGELDPSLRSWLDKAISEDALISVRSLCSPFSTDPEKAYISYAESYCLVKYLMGDYGGDRMMEMLMLFKQGTTCDEALTEVYGFDIEGLNVRLREALMGSTAGTVGYVTEHGQEAVAVSLPTRMASLIPGGSIAPWMTLIENG